MTADPQDYEWDCPLCNISVIVSPTAVAVEGHEVAVRHLEFHRDNHIDTHVDEFAHQLDMSQI